MSDRLTDADLREDSLASYDAALREMRTTDSRTQRVAAVSATRCIVSDTAAIRLVLADGDDALAAIVLGSADATALASDLLLAARRRLGRGLPEEAA